MADPLRFVVHRHETPDGVHWDLMLEQADGLATWRLPVPPEQIGPDPVAVERIFDHPKRFLTYEGPLRSHPGRVSIHDSGTYDPIGLSRETWRIRVGGGHIRGIYELTLPDRASQAWWLRYLPE